MLFVDGSATIGGSGAGVFIKNPEGEELEYAIRFDFKASNNDAEYEAMIHGLQIAARLGARSLQVFSDSQLVVHQVPAEFETRDDRMMQYVGRVRDLLTSFTYCELKQIPREENQQADFLARIGSSANGGGSRKMELILAGTRDIPPEVMNAQTENDWRSGIARCLRGILLSSKR